MPNKASTQSPLVLQRWHKATVPVEKQVAASLAHRGSYSYLISLEWHRAPESKLQAWHSKTDHHPEMQIQHKKTNASTTQEDHMKSNDHTSQHKKMPLQHKRAGFFPYERSIPSKPGMNDMNAMNVDPPVGSKPTIQHSEARSSAACHWLGHQSQPIHTASKPHDSPMTAPSATSHSCHVIVAELVSATVGPDKQFAMQVTGLKQACACHALPGESVSECMTACFKRNAWNGLNAALLHGMS